MNHPIYIIVATDRNNGIGIRGDLPWRLKKDLKFFQETTTKTKNPDRQNMVIMGRTTWESIPEKHQPLKNRHNVILTRNPDYKAEGAAIYHSLDEAIASADDQIENIFIIGGGKVYAEAINHPQLTGIYVTRIDSEYNCDAFFPKIPKNFSETKNLGKVSEDRVSFEFLFYKLNR